MSRLDSWKEIAAHLGRRVRTVQRWEATEGLPVHRHAHQRRGTVYAWTHELDDWLATRQVPPGNGNGTDDDPEATPEPMSSVASRLSPSIRRPVQLAFA